MVSHEPSALIHCQKKSINQGFYPLNYNEAVFSFEDEWIKIYWNISGNRGWRSGEIFFWTATINQWQRLLWPDRYKVVIMGSSDYLSNAGKIDVFAFVIMPNHLHLIWRTKELNGKETAQGSFLKYTAHEFRKMLYKDDRRKLVNY